MAQSKGDLTPERQILHLVQWFAEFSDFQRSDFMIDHLLTLYGQFLKNQLLLLEQNGTANGVGGEDGVASTEEQVITGLQALELKNGDIRPPSIFQCRMKLFTEWYSSWSDQDRLEFLTRLRNIDSGFITEAVRVFLAQQGITNYDSFVPLIKNRENNELLQRLELDNPELFVVANQPSDLVTNGVPGSDLSGGKPDLLNECHRAEVCHQSSSDEQSSSLEPEVAQEVPEIAEPEENAAPAPVVCPPPDLVA